jgi:hypothetical protein
VPCPNCRSVVLCRTDNAGRPLADSCVVCAEPFTADLLEVIRSFLAESLVLEPAGSVASPESGSFDPEDLVVKTA